MRVHRFHVQWHQLEQNSIGYLLGLGCTAVMLAYSLLQFNNSHCQHPTPKSALRASKHKNVAFFKHRFCRIFKALPQFYPEVLQITS